MTKEAPDLYFDLNSRDLNVRQRSELANIASALQEILHDFPDLIILIEGHCDGYGPIEDTHRIGIERVDVVRRFLLDFGLPHEHLRTVSLVYRTPQCKTFEEICHEKNCRVHFSAALAVPDSGAEK
jgi:outer membrane protein OmpA-like peptidoglycan-associated protein